MNLTTIEISPEEATERLAEYEGALRGERSAEDEAIAAGYRAAKRGLSVIELSKAVEAGGRFDNGLPRIAIARGDAKECWVEVRTWTYNETSELLYRDSAWGENRGALVGNHSVRVSAPFRGRGKEMRGHTIVPLIPPRHRPKRYRLKRCHVLWEVEAWTPVPPRDPALLRHIRGDLWAVLATWDLTQLERAVLSARTS